MNKINYNENPKIPDNLFVGIKDLSDLDYLIECFENGTKETVVNEDGCYEIFLPYKNYFDIAVSKSHKFSFDITKENSTFVYKDKLSILFFNSESHNG